MRVLLLLLLATYSHSGEPFEIPLSEIWALDMPGTKDIRSLAEPGIKIANPSSCICEKIQKYIAKLDEPIMRPGFVVSGQSVSALHDAYAALRNPGKHSYQKAGELSLFVFAAESGWYFRIERVVLAGRQIDVVYALVPHRTKELTTHFALIPLPSERLVSGEYRVVMKSAEQPETALSRPSAEQESKLVCSSFQFVAP